MIKKINQLGIGQFIFVIIVTTITVVLLVFTLLSSTIIFSSTDQLIESSSKEINKQVIMNYENYLSSVIDVSNSLQRYVIDLSKADDRSSLEALLVTTAGLNRNISSIGILDQVGYSTINSVSTSSVPILFNDEWVNQTKSLNDIHHFSSIVYDPFVLNKQIEVIRVSKAITIYDQGKSVDGMLLIHLDTEQFKLIGSRTNLGEQGHIIILDQNDEVVYDSSQKCTTNDCESIRIINDVIVGGKLISLEQTDMYVNVSTIRDTRWKIATFINVNAINQTRIELVYTIIAILLLTFLLVGIVSYYISKRLNKPMVALKNQVKQIEQGDFETHVTLSGQIEMVLLSEAFNSMSDRIKQLMIDVVEEQAQKRKSTIAALQNQINPHFLYNTLESIIWLSEQKRNSDVEAAILALSKFFRMSISDDHNMVTLSHEIEHVRNYLLIQQIRYNKSFNYVIDFSESIKSEMVLKLSLQPLVENAILHGLSPNLYSLIKISGWQDEENIYLEVYNEGYGLSTEKINEIYQMFEGQIDSSSVGLKNVYRRLKLFYGEAAEIIIKSVLDESTTVILKMPKKRENT